MAASAPDNNEAAPASQKVDGNTPKASEADEGHAEAVKQARKSIIKTNRGRTSIRDYERIELVEGRLEPLFRVFWRGRYQLYDKQVKD
jgi:hypothetical protein